MRYRKDFTNVWDIKTSKGLLETSVLVSLWVGEKNFCQKFFISGCLEIEQVIRESPDAEQGLLECTKLFLKPKAPTLIRPELIWAQRALGSKCLETFDKCHKTVDTCLETFGNVWSDGVTDRPKRKDRWGGLRNHLWVSESVTKGFSRDAIGSKKSANIFGPNTFSQDPYIPEISEEHKKVSKRIYKAHFCACDVSSGQNET